MMTAPAAVVALTVAREGVLAGTAFGSYEHRGRTPKRSSQASVSLFGVLLCVSSCA
jgi:hypothetical protein